MILIKPNHERRIQIPGVREPVRRPVDIDEVKTGFQNLRTLRIYRFDEASTIEGHAEEDEVFIIVLAGTIELTMMEESSTSGYMCVPQSLSAADGLHSIACAAYLPPGAAYNLVALTNADVAYARATPSSARQPRVFSSSANEAELNIKVVLEETAYAERLTVKLVRFSRATEEFELAPLDEGHILNETLVHIQAEPAEGGITFADDKSSRVCSSAWDTIAVAPGDPLRLSIAAGFCGEVLVVCAT